jgi:hypothetical protein
MAGPRFEEGWTLPEADLPSLRWVGLTRAWRMSGHLRACLSVLVVVIVLARIIGNQLGWRDPPVVLTLILVVATVGLGVLLAILAVFLSLGVLQTITGWPLHDLERWYNGLSVWAQLAVLPVLIAFVSAPAVVIVVGLLVASYWLAVGK